MTFLEPASLDALYEASKDDSTMFVGSDIRQLIGEIRRLRGIAYAPPGWCLVPSEPTQDIIDRMTASITGDDVPDPDYEPDMRRAYAVVVSSTDRGNA